MLVLLMSHRRSASLHGWQFVGIVVVVVVLLLITGKDGSDAYADFYFYFAIR